jgi:hypothetical protein
MLLNCKEGIGGIKAIYVTNFSAIENAFTLTGNEVATIAGSVTVFEYKLPKNTGSFTEEAAISIENGTVFYTQTVVASLHGLTSDRALELQTITKGRLVVFVLDSNDNIWMIGGNTSAEVTAFSTMTGTAKGDMNGYTVTFTAEEKNKAYYLTNTDPANPFDDYPAITISNTNL